MVRVSVKDVNQDEFVKQTAAFLKKSGKVKVPEWADLVKLSHHNELGPYDQDWYFVRTASIARRLYMRAPLGVGKFTVIYGGKRRRGSAPNHFAKSRSGVIKKCLQTLEALKWVEKHPEKGGRMLTGVGRRDLDRIASGIKKQPAPVEAE